MKALPVATALSLILALFGAARAEPPSSTPARHDARPKGSSLNVFLSPSGEPVRGGREAAYASAAWFAAADANHDGRLTLDEFRADARRAFARFDTNGDGVIDGFEIQHYEAEIAPEILPRIDGLRQGEGMDPDLFKPGRSGASRTGQAAGRPPRERRQIAGDRSASGQGLYGMLAEPEPLTAADTDLDGRVTLAEWLARTDVRFRLLDTANCGYLILDTLPKTQVQLLLEQRRAAAAKAAAAQPR